MQALHIPSIKMPSIKMPSMPTIEVSFLKSQEFWKYAVYAILVILMLTYAGMAFSYYQKNSMYTEDPKKVATLISIRRQDLSSAIDRLPSVETSVIASSSGTAPWSSIPNNKITLVNWRPLTVRLCGYLGGANGIRNGVFDMNYGITKALKLGARGFFFDIDYLEAAPCAPVLLYRDEQGYKRSLMSGSVKDGMTAIANNAFLNNQDPVLIFVYLRRVPKGPKQQNTFFTNLAKALKPLDSYFLKKINGNSAFGLQSELTLFTTRITSFSNNCIVMINYNTTTLTGTSQDNLNYWNNARIYQHTTGTGSSIGKITPAATSPSAYVQVADAKEILLMTADQQAAFAEKNRSVFTIAIREPEYQYKSSDLEILLNKLGVQSVPIDVLSNAASPDHIAALEESRKNTIAKSPLKVSDLSIDLSTSKKDPLAYWYFAGYSIKDVSATSTIPFYTIPTPATPQAPSPSTNSNGGLVSIG